MIGPPLTLNCQVPIGTYIQWLQYESDTDLNPTVISFNEDIVADPYKDNFTIIVGTSGGDVYYNLQMNNLQMQYGARYGCLNVGDNSRVFSYVISLG